MARAPVGQIPLSAQLNPVATPVDTYAQPAKSPLRDVADALGTVDKSLQTWVQTRDKTEEENQAILGTARIAKEGDQGDFAQLVNSGKIPAQYSPFYVKAAKNAIGAASGDRLTAGWQDYWDNLPDTVKLSEDPKAVPNAIQDYLKGKLGTDDPQVLKGVLPSVQALQSNAMVAATQYRHEKLLSSNTMAHGSVISSAVDAGMENGLLAADGPDYDHIFGMANASITDAIKNGDPGDKSKNTFIDVMSAKILDAKDPGLLKWFDTLVPGTNIKWGDTPHGVEVKLATQNNLETIAHSQTAAATAEQNRQDKITKENAEATLTQAIVKDPRAPLDEAALVAAETHGHPTIRKDVMDWRDTVLKGVPSDPVAIQGVYAKIISGENDDPMQTIRDAMSHGVFTNGDDLTKAATFAQSYKGQQSTIEKDLNGPVSKNLLEAIRIRTTSAADLVNPIAGTTNAGFEAQSDFRDQLTRWRIDHPNASPQEASAAAQSIGKTILDAIQPPDITGGRPDAEPAYDRSQTGITTPNAFDQGGKKPPPAGNQDVLDSEKALGVTDENRKVIEDSAKKNGMSYDEYYRKTIMAPPKAKPTSGAAGQQNGLLQKTSYDPSSTDLGEGDHTQPVSKEQAGQWIDQAFSGPGSEVAAATNSAKPLLDLVGQAESGGNYNAIYGKPNNTTDLSHYTLDQILGAQQYARRNGSESTAIGKYQIIYKTLKGLKDDLGLKGSEQFTPELQEQLGEGLLKRRGLDDFRAGKISKGQFALSLSQEWAGLPSPETGRSFYQGVGNNASRVGSQEVWKAMGIPVSGDVSGVSFDHPEQAAGVKRQLVSAVADVGRELGISPEIMSGYRSPEHNAAVGGAKNSAHKDGDAVDINIGSMSTAQRMQVVQGLMQRGVKRFITYSREPNMMHVDLRDQRGDGSPYFMYDKSAANLDHAPAWFRALAAVAPTTSS